LPKCLFRQAFLTKKTLAISYCALNIGMDSNITVTDLIAIRDVINLAAERGAFKAEEMLNVGTLYNKLNSFVEAVVMQQAVQVETTQGE
jgi:hypothetical protein